MSAVPALAPVPRAVPPPAEWGAPGRLAPVPGGLAVIEGYASLFDAVDLAGDVVLRGAFAASIAARGPAGIRMLWQHDPAEPVGAWTRVAEDRRGLFVRGHLNLAVARARELHALVEQGAVDGLSIGFRPVVSQPDSRRGLRRLARVDLWEVSLVTFPLQPNARLLPRP